MAGPQREEYANLFKDTEFQSHLSKEEAFAIILTAAIYVDQQVRRVELQEHFALLSRTRTLSAVSEEERRKLHERAVEAVQDPKRLWDQVGNACGKLLSLDKDKKDDASRNICISAFSHACDLIFADQDVLDTEKDLLAFMAERLEIPPERAREILRVMQAKNRF